MAATNQHNRSGGRADRRQQQSTKSEGTMAAVRDELSDYAERGASQMREITRDREGTALLIALGAGFGIGYLIGCSLASSQNHPRRWGDRSTAEGIGRRVLERIEKLMPEAITEKLSW
jgi:hypothetical protein